MTYQLVIPVSFRIGLAVGFLEGFFHYSLSQFEISIFDVSYIVVMS